MQQCVSPHTDQRIACVYPPEHTLASVNRGLHDKPLCVHVRACLCVAVRRADAHRSGDAGTPEGFGTPGSIKAGQRTRSDSGVCPCSRGLPWESGLQSLVRLRPIGRERERVRGREGERE